MPAVRQASFSAGELAPALWGRTDLPRYAAGLRRCFNFFIAKYGSAVSRAGAEMCGLALSGITTLYNDGFEEREPVEQLLEGDNVKLVPFQYSATPTDPNTGTSVEQNYVLIFGNQSLQIYKNGQAYAFTLNFGGGATQMPYLASDLYKLRWAQSGDVLYLACAGYPPATLSRGVPGGTDTEWTYAVINFARSGPVTFTPGNRGGAQLDQDLWTDNPPGYTPTTAEPFAYVSWCVTEQLQDGNGYLTESAPVHVSGLLDQGQSWVPLITYVPYTGSGPVGSIVFQATKVGGTPMTRYWVCTQATPVDNPPDDSYQPPPNSTNASTYWSYCAPVDPTKAYVIGNLVANGSDETGLLEGSSQVYLCIQDAPAGTLLTNAAYYAPQIGAGFTDCIGNKDCLATVYPDKTQSIIVEPTAGAPAGYTLYGYNVYRGRASSTPGQPGVYGFVGFLGSAGGTFIDTGLPADLTNQPPLGVDPFEATPGSVSSEDFPVSVTFFQDRLVFGGTTNLWPTRLLCSTSGDYLNFDSHLVPVDSDTVITDLIARKREHIRAVVGLDKLFTLTNGGAWVVGGAEGSEGSALTPSSIDVHLYSDIGSDWPSPLIIHGNVVYARDKGTGVRALQFDWQRGGYASSSLSDQAEHLFLGYQLEDWCFAESPWGVAWVVRDDGFLLSATYCPDDNLWAWGQHQLQGPVNGVLAGVKVISVCSITEGDEDFVYLAVQGPRVVPPAWQNKPTVYAQGALVVYNGSSWISQQNGNSGNAPESGAWWLPYGSTTGPAYILRMSSRLVYDDNEQVLGNAGGTVQVPVCLDFWQQTSTPAVVGGLVTLGLCNSNSATFANAGDFLAISWMAQIDGVVSGPYAATVNHGNVVINVPYNAQTGGLYPNPPQVANVGQPYNCELELLDVAAARSQKKVVSEVDFEVVGTGTLLVGTDSNNLLLSKPINANNQLLRVPAKGNWNTAGRAFLRQSNPVPLTVVGVIRKVETDDDP